MLLTSDLKITNLGMYHFQGTLSAETATSLSFRPPSLLCSHSFPLLHENEKRDL